MPHGGSPLLARRKRNGYDEDDGYHKGVDAVYDKLRELLDEHGINTDKLVV